MKWNVKLTVIKWDFTDILISVLMSFVSPYIFIYRSNAFSLKPCDQFFILSIYIQLFSNGSWLMFILFTCSLIWYLMSQRVETILFIFQEKLTYSKIGHRGLESDSIVSDNDWAINKYLWRNKTVDLFNNLQSITNIVL